MKSENIILYVGGTIVVIAGYYLLKKKDTTSTYAYDIYNENNVTKALNLKTNKVDFQDTNSGIVIQNAIDKDPNIHIKSGLYTGGFLQGRLGLIMDGDGRNTIYQLKPNSNTTTFDIKGNSTIRNLVIDGNKANQSSPGHGINISNSSNVSLQNLYVKNSKGWDCINTDTCSNINISNSEIEGADGFGTRLYNSSNCTIDSCHYHNCSRINIDLDTSSDNKITNNVSHDSLEDGIAIDFNSTNNLIQYNKSYNNLHYGIATDTVHQPHLGKNTIDNNQLYNNGLDGILLVRGDYNIISNNKSHDNVNSGILVEGRIQSEGTDTTGRVNYTDIYNNECYNNDYGIREYAPPNYVCQYNKFSNNSTYNNRIVNQLLEGTNHRS